MINFDDYVDENKTKHNKNWLHTPDYPYRILVIGGSGSGRTNALLNLIDNQPGIDKIYLYVKALYDAKYQYLTNIRTRVWLKLFSDPRVFIEYWNYMHNVYKNIDEYNPDKDRKIWIAFDDMIADMINNKKLNSIITELFIRERKLFLLFLSRNHVLRFQRMLDLILLTFSSQKFQMKEDFDKLLKIIH